jgi:antitoxin (DNA-binding transcriptional repressor) of toxin-antitoxin stability system
MKTVGVRDIRQRWPQVEKELEREGELCITRDGKPVAKLVRFSVQEKPRRRFDPEEHARRMRELWGDRVFDVDALLEDERAREDD